ncbi:MAG: glutamate--tRNA ligase [bacterium]
MSPPVRVRFCPSPTGTTHVGLMRTCLFNWAYARHVGGTFVFRIEDTDAPRNTEASYRQLLDTMRWMGFDWDEGPEVGGLYGPYRQSERGKIYADVLSRLREAGHLYESFSTPAEVEARHRAAGRDPKRGYDNADRELSEQAKAALRAGGREPVLRLRMPNEDLVWDDVVRGEVRVAAGTDPDFVVARSTGEPLYTLVNPVDDALMKITHVLRGEDLLPSTPRQIALYRALMDIGVADAIPRFGHLPYVTGEGNRKLSKRDPQGSFETYRDGGFIAEGMINYLALLGWSIAPDHDIFTLEEMVAAFDVADVNANPARFDLRKCEAINAAHLRRLTGGDFAGRLADQMARERTKAGRGPLSDAQRAVVYAAAPLIQERVQTLAEGSAMVEFLVVDEAVFEVEEKAAAKHLGPDGRLALTTALDALKHAPQWSTSAIEEALRAALVEGLQLKPRNAYGPVRVATTGRPVSPPLFESLELLGRERTLRRLAAAVPS